MGVCFSIFSVKIKIQEKKLYIALEWYGVIESLRQLRKTEDQRIYTYIEIKYICILLALLKVTSTFKGSVLLNHNVIIGSSVNVRESHLGLISASF